VQTCPVQLCVIVRENVTEKTTLSSFLSDSETNYTALYSLMYIRFVVHVRQKQQKNIKTKIIKKNMEVGQFLLVGASGFG